MHNSNSYENLYGYPHILHNSNILLTARLYPKDIRYFSAAPQKARMRGMIKKLNVCDIKPANYKN